MVDFNPIRFTVHLSKKKLTLAEAAGKMDVDVGTIWRWKTGRRKPWDVNIKKMRMKLGFE